MYDDLIEGGGGGRPWPRGTKLADELDRRLAGDEPLTKVINWWTDSWSATVSLHKIFPYGDKDIQPRNFSDHEFAAFMASMLCGCFYEAENGNAKKVTDLRWLRSNTGIDGAKVAADADYAWQLMEEWIERLERARAVLRN
jgi:hypothetical protein